MLKPMKGTDLARVQREHLSIVRANQVCITKLYKQCSLTVMSYGVWRVSLGCDESQLFRVNV